MIGLARLPTEEDVAQEQVLSAQGISYSCRGKQRWDVVDTMAVNVVIGEVVTFGCARTRTSWL